MLILARVAPSTTCVYALCCLPPLAHSYNQSLAAVKAARTEFDRLSHPHQRPLDCFAEMLKSDDHMARVKTKLISETKRMEAVDARRKAQEARKFARAMAAERTAARAASKKANMDAIKAWSKGKGKNTGAPGVVDDVSQKELEKLLSNTGHATGGARAARSGPVQKSRKAKAKDSKYGFGGRKKFKKSNDSKSASDMSAFSSGRNRSLPKGIKSRRKPTGGASRGGRAGGRR